MRTYLDHNATTPLRPEARSAVLAALDVIGNPSSVHAEGRRARAIVETAREQVAALINAHPAQVVFTSGATEANAWALAAGWKSVFAAALEHDSVLGPARAIDGSWLAIPANGHGVIRLEGVAWPAANDAATRRSGLIAVQMANNETGVLQPVAEVVTLAARCGLAVHTDAVQAAGREAIDFAALGVDTLSLSSHKLGGPKGVGALVIKDGTSLSPLIHGGGQERRRRAGTENVSGIAGFGAAAAAARRDVRSIDRVRRLRNRLERAALAAAPSARVIGGASPRIANTTCLAVPGAAAETLVIKFDLAGIAVSAGAACSSGKVGPSHVLSAMGIDADLARSAIRVSLGWTSTDADIDAFLAAWAAIIGNAKARRAA